MKLGFVAGSVVRGPWRFDFNDRGAPSMENLKPTTNIQEVNGVDLDEIFNNPTIKNKTFKQLVQFPRKECEIALIIAKLSDSEYTIEPKEDHIILVLKGEGNVTVNSDIFSKVYESNSFIVPKNIKFTISSSEMILMDFG